LIASFSKSNTSLSEAIKLHTFPGRQPHSKKLLLKSH
jgi:hypothetical protein